MNHAQPNQDENWPYQRSRRFDEFPGGARICASSLEAMQPRALHANAAQRKKAAAAQAAEGACAPQRRPFGNGRALRAARRAAARNRPCPPRGPPPDIQPARHSPESKPAPRARLPTRGDVQIKPEVRLRGSKIAGSKKRGLREKGSRKYMTNQKTSACSSSMQKRKK